MAKKIPSSEQLNMGDAMAVSDELKEIGCGFNMTHGYKKIKPNERVSTKARFLIECMHEEATAKLCAAYLEGCLTCPLGFVTVDQLVEIIQPLSK